MTDREETKAQIAAYAMYWLGELQVMKEHEYLYDVYQIADAVAQSYTNRELDYIEENSDLDPDEVLRRVEKRIGK